MTKPIKLMKLKDVMNVTTLARATIYKYIAAGTFPKQVSTGGRRVAWNEEKVQDWIRAKVAESDSEPTV